MEVLPDSASTLQAQFFPVLNMSCDPGHKDAIHILDDGITFYLFKFILLGLTLWYNFVQQSTAISPELMAFFDRLPSIVEANRDDNYIVRASMRIIEGNFLCY